MQTGWEEVKPYIGINEHLKGVEMGRHTPKVDRRRPILNYFEIWFCVFLVFNRFIGFNENIQQENVQG
jgi:hypothetical protein